MKTHRRSLAFEFALQFNGARAFLGDRAPQQIVHGGRVRLRRCAQRADSAVGRMGGLNLKRKFEEVGLFVSLWRADSEVDQMGGLKLKRI
jgi:hypothetical protein